MPCLFRNTRPKRLIHCRTHPCDTCATKRALASPRPKVTRPLWTSTSASPTPPAASPAPSPTFRASSRRPPPPRPPPPPWRRRGRRRRRRRRWRSRRVASFEDRPGFRVCPARAGTWPELWDLLGPGPPPGFFLGGAVRGCGRRCGPPSPTAGYTCTVMYHFYNPPIPANPFSTPCSYTPVPSGLWLGGRGGRGEGLYLSSTETSGAWSDGDGPSPFRPTARPAVAKRPARDPGGG